MKKYQVRIYALILTLLAWLLPAPTASAASADGMIRVWLSSIRGNTTYNLTIQGTYVVGGQTLASGSRVVVEFSGGTVYVTANGMRTAMGSSVTLARQSGGVRIAESLSPSNTYPGEMRFFYSGGTAYVVCALHIEDYLYGVLPYEMSNSFPLEALKAQAVAARTYAAFSKKSSGVYDVTDTVSHQVFRGVNAGNTRCIQAVDGTAGQVLMYGGAYIEASFGASNGGQTETRYNAWGSSRVAYQQVKDDPYDLANSASIVRSYMLYATPSNGSSAAGYAMIQTALAQSLGGSAANYTINEILDVTLHTPKYAAPSRVYTQMGVTVRYNGTQSTALNIPIFTTVKPALGLKINTTNNELFTVTKEAGGFRISARRYGHGIGLSQRGAQQMANSGMGYQSILSFYYEGAQLTTVQFTSNWSGGSQTPPPGAVTEPPSVSTSTPGVVTLSNAGSFLNLRKGPGTQTAVIGLLPNGASLTITGTEGSWYAVRYGTLVGYAARQYVTVQAGGIAPETPQGQEGTNAIVNVSGMLNLRAGKGTDTAIVGRIPSGAALTVIERGDVWSSVRYGSLTGYVMTGYLIITGEIAPVETTAPVATATPDAAGTYATVSLSNPNEILNLREGASIYTRSLAQLRQGAMVQVVQRDTIWSQVTYGDLTGYVMNAFLSFGGAQPEATTTPQPTATPIPQREGIARGIVSVRAGTLNLRARPMAGSSVLAGIPNNAEIVITNMNSVWCAVQYRGISGFVMRAYVTIIDSGDTAPLPQPEEESGDARYATVDVRVGTLNLRSYPSLGAMVLMGIPNQARVEVISMDDEWCAVRYGTYQGYVMRSFLIVDGVSAQTDAPAAEKVTATKAWIATGNGGGANLRAGQSTDSEVLGTVPDGAQVNVLLKKTEWSQIDYQGAIGYLMSEFLKDEAPAVKQAVANTTETIGYIASPDGNVNLRKTPSLEAEVLALLAHGTQLTMLETQGEWTHVRHGDDEGYVMAKYTTGTVPEAAATATIAPTATPEATKTPDDTIIVNRGSVEAEAATLRADAALEAEATGSLPRGMQVEVLRYAGSGAEWAYVRADAGSGYVLREALSLESGVVVVAVEGGGALNVRAAASAEAEVIGAVGDGVALTVLSAEDDWARVRLSSGTVGYVREEYLVDANG